ncbi:Arsenate reductase thioredoxin-coupled, LMWP family [hydrothermal vent metagenome]|uniref:Arsenate reductase thioredoxin-coupled, LMWP family n=1 Tax=hydrothermal vent metagenome TaxID=652676 RepID=A0A3B0UGM3_9ZZZZ
MENLILHRLTALGHPKRMAVFRLLMRRYPDKVSAGELAQALGFKASTLSVYLAVLARAGLVDKTRAGTWLLYRVQLDAAREIIDYLFFDCCRGRAHLCPILDPGQAKGALMMPERKHNVIFICTGNSARSILAEAILRHEAGERFNAYSAGTRPAGAPNPFALELLKDMGHETRNLRSKSLDEFQGADAPKMDFIFTVCDAAANEECPLWPGQPVSGHWGIADPAAVLGTDAEKRQAFAQAYERMQARIGAFIALFTTGLDKADLQQQIDKIGAMEQMEQGVSGDG